MSSGHRVPLLRFFVRENDFFNSTSLRRMARVKKTHSHQFMMCVMSAKTFCTDLNEWSLGASVEAYELSTGAEVSCHMCFQVTVCVFLGTRVGAVTAVA